MKRHFLYGWAFIFTLLGLPLMMQAQSTIDRIKQAVSQEKFTVADSILRNHIQFFTAQKKPDSLLDYIYYEGLIAEKLSGKAVAKDKVMSILKVIRNLHPGNNSLRQSWIEAGSYFGHAGNSQQAYHCYRQALDYGLQTKPVSPEKIAQVFNNMAAVAQRLGRLDSAKSYGYHAIKWLGKDPNPDLEILYAAYNSMGSTMWYSSKLDSALYFFNQALGALKKAPQTPLNRYYRPAIIYNNMAGISHLNRNTTAAIEQLNSCISLLKNFQDSAEAGPKKDASVALQYEGIDNLGGIYKELGDYSRARQLLEYSYLKKRQYSGEDDPGAYISQVLLGQLYYAWRDYDKALNYLQTAMSNFQALEGGYYFWQGDACYTLALINEAHKNIPQASLYYKKADSLYAIAMGGEYDNIYLEFLRNQAQFYAENGKKEMAKSIGLKTSDYMRKTRGAQSMGMFAQLLNLSEISFLSNQYVQATQYADQGMDVLNINMKRAGNLLDSISMELKMPRAILLKVKAQYRQMQTKDKKILKRLAEQMEVAMTILERRKSLINDPENNRLLMADNSDLLGFAKRLYMDLYELDPNDKYLNKIMDLQESVLYNRIRSRLASNDSIQFAHVPKEIQEKELRLKEAVDQALHLTGATKEVMQNYFDAEAALRSFIENLKINYPAYYQLKYATIVSSLNNVMRHLAPDITLVRYFFIDTSLYALVVSKGYQKIFHLHPGNIEDDISFLQTHSREKEQSAAALLSLYNTLWQPFAEHVRTQKVIVIPDGILYAVNFEILTPERIENYRDLAKMSLLAHHTFSYDYSLFLLGEKSKRDHLSNEFVSFAPGFSNSLKDQYRNQVTDSMNLDLGYLSLLPQPFTLGLLKTLKNFFGGKSYMDMECTKENFVQYAGNHKIIHIGTHAESNNLHPELSKLIFAKSEPSIDNNVLYVQNIYSCELTSSLTVLAACESGKPGFQDGEGMISLAHAFNYAGSQSILTALWRIDEKTSTILIKHFYDNLVKGMEKDEALRQAKLKYLREENGNMLAPHFWAGLVLLGDTSAMQLEQQNSSLWWYFGGAAFLILIFFLVRYLNRKQ